jgi:5-methylcytosine-specific restriction endonuclease McrA
MLEDGRLHLSAIALLSPHLTRQNCDALARRAVHRSKREIEELVAEICPRPDAPALVRRLPNRIESAPVLAPASFPAQAPAGVEAGVGAIPSRATELRPDGVDTLGAKSVGPQQPIRASARAVIEPLAPSRYKVQFTASAELCGKLERLQALLRAEHPKADLGDVIDRAVTQTLQRLESRRYARTSAPRTAVAEAMAPDVAMSRRYIPADVRRRVFERDDGRCRYRDEAGRRCPERHGLEYHHLHPFAMGGGHTLDNVRLMCRTHNLYLAEHDYGRRAMATYREPKIDAPPAPKVNSRAPGPHGQATGLASSG